MEYFKLVNCTKCSDEFATRVVLTQSQIDEGAELPNGTLCPECGMTA